MKQPYQEFVQSKRVEITPSGFVIDRNEINPQLFDWQGDIVRWALHRGKAALFEDCGLGKSAQQLEWAKQVCQYTGGDVLILAPLGVVKQTQREGEKFNVSVTVCRASSDVRPGVNITNYDMMKHFDPADFVGIVLDESSLLKGGTLGIMFNEIVAFGSTIDYRLCCTATPAPNDIEELIAHAEFLGIMRSNEIKALYFTQDGNDTTKWRLKRHAEKDFWKWMAEWSIALRKPSDLGYSDEGFVLPPLNVHQVTVDLEEPINEGQLFAVEAVGLTEQRKAGKLSLEGRVQICADMVNALDEPCAVWVNMNYESEAITQAIPGAVEITGSDSSQYKEDSLLGFASGDYRVMVTKPRIAGFGMNFQHCRKVFVVGLSHSYEQYYQLIRRFYRFGQTKPVDIYVIVSSADGQIVENIKRKEQQAMITFDNIVKHMSVNIDLRAMAVRDEMVYQPQKPVFVPSWLVPVPSF